MALSRIDELNNFEYIYSDSEINKMLWDYFDVMEISEKEKEKRVEASKDFRNAMLFLFTLISVAYEYGYFSIDYVLMQFRNEFANVVVKYVDSTPFIEKYFEKATRDIVQTTIDHFDPSQKTFWDSDDRAIIVAENESNSILNYDQLQKAKEKGYTMKEWRTERDSRVRKTHRNVDGKRIPIDDYFVFPDCVGLFPHDELNLSDSELANCRCTLKFS